MSTSTGFFGSMFGGNKGPATTAAQDAAPATQAPAATEPAPTPTGVAALDLLFQPSQEADKDIVPELNLTPEIMGQVIQGKNFMAGITEEMVTQIQSGDTKALMAMIQQVGRNSYEQAMLDSTSLAGRYAGTRADFAAQQSAKSIRGHVIESQMDVASLSPTAQGMFRTIATKVAERNPSASAAEVQAQATLLLQDLANEFNFDGRQQAAAKPVETDWSDVFALKK